MSATPPRDPAPERAAESDQAVADKAKLLLVGDYGLNRLRIIDLDSGKEKGSVETPSLPNGIAVNADQSIAAVTKSGTL